MVKQVTMFETATSENFREQSYLKANPDLDMAIRHKRWASGRQHADELGFAEGRRQYCEDAVPVIESMRKAKLDRLTPLLLDDASTISDEGVVDSLSKEMREKFNIVATNKISAHAYDPSVVKLVNSHPDGLVLDCGAGFRPTYYENVVNYEIVDYPTTDVIGVGEKLPFKDNSFDAVITIAVLEHVRYPFQAAAEIVRVLKSGGELYAAVPFLQPLHGFPHHYFNMTQQGLATLFENGIEVESHTVPRPFWPIQSLTWMLRSYANGLKQATREDFLDMKVGDLIRPGRAYFDQPFCTELSDDKRFELASGTLLRGTKIKDA